MFEYFKCNKRDRRKRKMQPITLIFHVLLLIKIKCVFLCIRAHARHFELERARRLYVIIRKNRNKNDKG